MRLVSVLLLAIPESLFHVLRPYPPTSRQREPTRTLLASPRGEVAPQKGPHAAS